MDSLCSERLNEDSTIHSYTPLYIGVLLHKGYGLLLKCNESLYIYPPQTMDSVFR